MSELALLGGKPVRTKLFPAYNVIGEEEKAAARRVLDSGILSRYLGSPGNDFMGGPEVQRFERDWAEFFGVKHAIAVNSCTSGLQCAVGAAGISPGDEVIVSPYTMAASATAPLIYGGIPVFADIEFEYFCLDPKSVEKQITPKTKAIIVVDIFGQPYDVEKINMLAKQHGLIVIEDCAQAPGAKYKGSYAGTLGDIGVYSLNYHKHIHTGEGGVITTNDDKFAERLRLIRNHAEAVVGSTGTDNFTNMVGFNMRLTEIQAAMGREQIKKLTFLIESRVKNSLYLAEKIGQIPGFYSPQIRENATHAYYTQPFLYDEEKVGISREKFVKAVEAELPATALREAEGTLIGFGNSRPLYLLPLFQKKIAIGSAGFPFSLGRDVSYQKGICPVAESLCEKKMITTELMRPPATAEDLTDVVKAFEKVYANRKDLM